MPMLIDGHNLIGQMHGISLSDPDDEEQLLERLAVYQRRRHMQITVVFDAGAHGGLPGRPEPSRAGIGVLYARPGQRADDVICRLVRRASDRRGILVVTSDRAVQDEVRHLGATVIAAQEFARQLAAPKAKPPRDKERPPSPGEVDEWLRIFSERRKRPRPPA